MSGVWERDVVKMVLAVFDQLFSVMADDGQYSELLLSRSLLMLTHCTAVKSREKDGTMSSECGEMTGIRGRKGWV